jgi:hypothetical protein
VTPFDPVALVAMLNVFYPVVSATTLAQARAERWSYFAGGTLGGDSGTLLTLGDGRTFALITPVFASGPKWSARLLP